VAQALHAERSPASTRASPRRSRTYVYADRLGNGDEASGDGWLYRGRGIFQLTGRANYRDCSIAIAGDADTLLTESGIPHGSGFACQSAGWFWASRGLSDLAERGGFEEITRKINGGLIGLPERLKYWNRAIAMLSAPDAREARRERLARAPRARRTSLTRVGRDRFRDRLVLAHSTKGHAMESHKLLDDAKAALKRRADANGDGKVDMQDVETVIGS
jgi:hypothetical protein